MDSELLYAKLADRKDLFKMIQSNICRHIPDPDKVAAFKKHLSETFDTLRYSGVEAPDKSKVLIQPAPQFFRLRCQVPLRAGLTRRISFTCGAALDIHRTGRSTDECLLVCWSREENNPLVTPLTEAQVWISPLPYASIRPPVSSGSLAELIADPARFVRSKLLTTDTAGLVLSVMTQRLENHLPASFTGVLSEGVVSPYGQLIVGNGLQLVCPGGLLQLNTSYLKGNPRTSRAILDTITERNFSLILKYAGLTAENNEGWSNNVKAQVARELMLHMPGGDLYR